MVVVVAAGETAGQSEGGEEEGEEGGKMHFGGWWMVVVVESVFGGGNEDMRERDTYKSFYMMWECEVWFACLMGACGRMLGGDPKYDEVASLVAYHFSLKSYGKALPSIPFSDFAKPSAVSIVTLPA